MNKQHEERIADLVDELLDQPEDEFLSGKMMRTWAEKCLEQETEERTAVVAFLKHAMIPKAILNMVEQGAHRKRSTQAMRALKVAAPQILAERQATVASMGASRKPEERDVANGGARR